MKIIDFHTHTFEDYVAARAIEKLSKSANILNYYDGTDDGLIKLNKTDEITLSVSLPVATKIMQADHINSRNYKKNKNVDETGVMYFAAIHPEDSNIRVRLANIKAAGFKGIKLHPIFQDAYINEKCYLELIDTASEMGLITVIHAGYDISYPGNDRAGVPFLLDLIETVHPEKLVLAHMGGWGQWDLVESDLAGADVYLDTSMSLNKLIHPYANGRMNDTRLSSEQFVRIVKKHGADKIVFGTDTPWSDRSETITNIANTGLKQEELDKIYFENAYNLFDRELVL